METKIHPIFSHVTFKTYLHRVLHLNNDISFTNKYLFRTFGSTYLLTNFQTCMYLQAGLGQYATGLIFIAVPKCLTYVCTFLYYLLINIIHAQ